MSYRSALSNPQANSGNVGQVISVATPIQISIPLGLYYNVNQITLSPGVWSVNIALGLSYTTASVITAMDFYLASSPTTPIIYPLYWSKTFFNGTNTTTVGTLINTFDVYNVCLTLLEPKTLYLNVFANVTGANPVVVSSNNTTNYTIQATKLA